MSIRRCSHEQNEYPEGWSFPPGWDHLFREFHPEIHLYAGEFQQEKSVAGI